MSRLADCSSPYDRIVNADLAGRRIEINDMTLEGPVHTNGDLYVVWERGYLSPLLGPGAAPQIVFSRSEDGGPTFAKTT